MKQAVAAAAGCTIGSVVDALVGAVVKAATNAAEGPELTEAMAVGEGAHFFCWFRLGDNKAGAGCAINGPGPALM